MRRQHKYVVGTKVRIESGDAHAHSLGTVGSVGEIVSANTWGACIHVTDDPSYGLRFADSTRTEDFYSESWLKLVPGSSN